VLLFVTEDPVKTRSLTCAGWLQIPGTTTQSFHFHSDLDAIRHLFRVSAGLDSMVVGEEQILSQVKDAGLKARTSGTPNGMLSVVFDGSVSAGRRIRASSNLSSPNRSVSALGLMIATRELRRLRKILLIGSGKTIRLAAGELKEAEVYVATRRKDVPGAFPGALPGAIPVEYNNLKKVAGLCDLIVSATKYDGYLLKKGDLNEDRRRILLDLAFPRNLDPEFRTMKGTKLYDLDDLGRIAALQPIDAQSLMKAEELVSTEAEEFSRRFLASRLSSAIPRLYRWAEGIRGYEADAALRRLPGLTEKEKRVVAGMSRRLVSKLLAPPTRFARSSSPKLSQTQRLEIVNRLFEEEDRPENDS
jgi:glutamyl-tRNA reductase